MFQPIRLFIFAVSLLMSISMVSLADGILLTHAESGGAKPGSVLIYNFYTSQVGDSRNDTQFTLTNTHATEQIYVRLFLVDGSSCSMTESYLCLRPNQTTRMMASDIDPGVRGYMLAVAVDGKTGCPVNFNHLIGSAYVNYYVFQTKLPAESIAALFTEMDCGSDKATLHFDGHRYQRLPSVLALEDVASMAEPNRNKTLLILNRIGGDTSGMASLGTLNGLLFDDAENAFAFTTEGGCQFFEPLTDARILTVPAFPIVIPAGRSGWLKIWTKEFDALTGAALRVQEILGSDQLAFSGGANLHHLRLAKTSTFTFNLMPPTC